jgi:hypothetical protein
MIMNIVSSTITTFAVGLGLVLAAGCRATVERSASDVSKQWRPWTNEVTTAEQLGSALEARWSLEMIRFHCDVVTPTPLSIQNLVVMGEEWRGSLYPYEAEASGIDISWYASARNGKLEVYSLNAAKGRKRWIVEMGNQETLLRPPISSRDPNRRE